MVIRLDGEVVWQCNGCGELLESNTDDFEEAKRALDANTWRTRKEGEDWEHFCPEC